MVYDLKMNLYEHIEKKGILFFNNKHIGELMIRVLNEVPDIVSLIFFTPLNIISQLVTFILALSLMININVYITIFSLVLIPVIFLILKYFKPRIKDLSSIIMQNSSNTSNTLQENLANFKLIKYLRLYNHRNLIFSESLKKGIISKYNYLKISTLCSSILSFLYLLPSVIIFIYGGYLVISNKLTTGSFIALTTYISYLYAPINALSNINIELQKSINASNRFFEIVNCNNNVELQLSHLDKLKTGIEIKNISFSYTDKKSVFYQLDLSLDLGEIIQIYGSNGTGKSTFIDILSGILNPCEGEIKYDNISVKYLDDNSFKKMLTIVPQNTSLFNDTIRNNIILGETHSDIDILKLSKELGYEDVVCGKDLNLDTIISNNGSNLSGGQRQKISILRALIRNSQICILDEASSFLDVKSRKLLYRYLNNKKKNRIIIIILHDDISDLKIDKTINLDAYLNSKDFILNA